jgi:hypothetical protein
MRAFVCLVLLGASLSAGAQTLTCSDPIVVKLIKDVYQKSLVTATSGHEQASMIVQEATKHAVPNVGGISTIDRNQTTGRVACVASLTVKLPAVLIPGVQRSDFFLAPMMNSLQLTATEEGLSRELHYVASLTDDKTQVRLSVRGATEMGQMVARMATLGLFRVGT